MASRLGRLASWVGDCSLLVGWLEKESKQVGYLQWGCCCNGLVVIGQHDHLCSCEKPPLWKPIKKAILPCWCNIQVKEEPPRTGPWFMATCKARLINYVACPHYGHKADHSLGNPKKRDINNNIVTIYIYIFFPRFHTFSLENLLLGCCWGEKYQVQHEQVGGIAGAAPWILISNHKVVPTSETCKLTCIDFFARFYAE